MKISASERASGIPSADTMQEAVEHFMRDGYVLLEDALEPSYVEELRVAYTAALDDKIRRCGIAPVVPRDERTRGNSSVTTFHDFRPEGGNHDLNRWNMHLPSRRPFLDARLVANPFAMPLIDTILGDDCTLSIIASDTPYPNSGFQAIHRDDRGLAVMVNIPLVDVTDDNAPIEVWPRTHLEHPERGSAAFSDGVVDSSPETMNKLAKLPSLRLHMRAGTILVRDRRMLHRGTANRSTEARPQLSLKYARPTEIAHRALTDWGARIALALREEARRDGRVDRELLNCGNLLGRQFDLAAGSDRDYRREIPAAIWHELSDRARRVLRLATVEGRPVPEPSLEESARLAARAFVGLTRGSTLLAKRRIAFPDARNGVAQAALRQVTRFFRRAPASRDPSSRGQAPNREQGHGTSQGSDG